MCVDSARRVLMVMDCRVVLLIVERMCARPVCCCILHHVYCILILILGTIPAHTQTTTTHHDPHSHTHTHTLSHITDLIVNSHRQKPSMQSTHIHTSHNTRHVIHVGVGALCSQRSPAPSTWCCATEHRAYKCCLSPAARRSLDICSVRCV